MDRRCFLAGLASFTCVSALSRAKEGPPAEIDRLVKQLGSRKFREREAATRALEKVGEAALPALRKAAKHDADAEVRRRAARLAHTIRNRQYREIRRFNGFEDMPDAVAFSPDGRVAIVGTREETVSLELKTGKSYPYPSMKGHATWSILFTPDGRRALSGYDERAILLWDVVTGKEIRRLIGHTGIVWCLAQSRDGRRALSGSEDGSMRLWDVDRGKEIRLFKGHSRPVWTVAYFPDGRRALSASRDRTMRVWDLASGKELACFEAHEDGDIWVALSPDGRQLISGGDDKTVRFWDAATGRELHCSVRSHESGR